MSEIITTCWDCSYGIYGDELPEDGSRLQAQLRGITRIESSGCCSELVDEGCCGHYIGTFRCWGCDEMIAATAYYDLIEMEVAR